MPASIQFGMKAEPSRRLPAGTKVQVNRPSHALHGSGGTVLSHGPTHVTVQHDDGSRHDHPISAIHYAPVKPRPTYEGLEALSESMDIHSSTEDASTSSYPTTHHLNYLRKLQRDHGYGPASSLREENGGVSSKIYHPGSHDWHKVHSFLNDGKVHHSVRLASE